MSILRFSVVIFLFLAFSLQLGAGVTFAETSQEEASKALTDSESSVVSAHQAVLKAEEAGANVTDLLIRLNQAGEYLARAHMEYRLGDFEKAVDFANLSRSTGEEAQSVAVALKDSATSERLQRMMFTMIASIVGVASIALGSFWVWYFLKKRYGKVASEIEVRGSGFYEH